MLQGKYRFNQASQPRCSLRMAEIWLDLSQSAPFGPVTHTNISMETHRANEDTLFTEDIADCVDLDRISRRRARSVTLQFTSVKSHKCNIMHCLPPRMLSYLDLNRRLNMFCVSSARDFDHSAT